MIDRRVSQRANTALACIAMLCWRDVKHNSCEYEIQLHARQYRQCLSLLQRLTDSIAHLDLTDGEILYGSVCIHCCSVPTAYRHHITQRLGHAAGRQSIYCPNHDPNSNPTLTLNLTLTLIYLTDQQLYTQRNFTCFLRLLNDVTAVRTLGAA